MSEEKAVILSRIEKIRIDYSLRSLHGKKPSETLTR